MDKEKKAKPEYIRIEKKHLCPECTKKLFCPVCKELKNPRSSLCPDCRAFSQYIKVPPKTMAEFYRSFAEYGIEDFDLKFRKKADRYLRITVEFGWKPTATDYFEFNSRISKENEEQKG